MKAYIFYQKHANLKIYLKKNKKIRAVLAF